MEITAALWFRDFTYQALNLSSLKTISRLQLTDFLIIFISLKDERKTYTG